MSNNTVRIRTTPNGSDKYLKVKIEQDFDFIEVLSLKISQEEAYRNFASDYGVVTGRVIINSGFGVPNAKVSIFIPLDKIDNKDPQIKGLYPFEVVTDRDNDGIRYNLLSKVSQSENECFTPIGTFPTKREILDNPEMLDIYTKYYKYTTTTNFAGDFMIFGVPVGTYVVHVDADISDIGIASQRPYDMIGQGTSEKSFESSTKFKGGTNLDKLVQVKTANVGVNVLPFWGEKESYEIGITRIDIDLNYTIKPSAIFMGSIYGDQDKNSVNKNCRPRQNMGKLCEQATSEGTIEMIRYNTDGEIEQFDVDGGGLIDEDGTWAYQIPMNLDYMVTDEFGNLVPSEDPNKGIPTRSRVRFKIGMNQTGGEGRLRTRAKYLVPNNPNNVGEIDYEFSEKTKDTSFRDLHWNKIYSINNYISRFQVKPSVSTNKLIGGNVTGIKDVDGCNGDKNPFPFNKITTNVSPIFSILCLIITIIGFLIFILNSLLIPIINLLLKAFNKLLEGWNAIVDALCEVSGKRILKVRIFKFLSFACKLHIELIEPIPCIYIKCDEKIFAPGCGSKTAKNALTQNTGISEVCHGGDNPIDLCGLPDCIAFQLAKALNLFQFDFYNDWVNGSLYSFLLKYKKKRKRKEKFCEYDCSDFGIEAGGVDGDKNGKADNACSNNFLADTCFGDEKDSQRKSKSMLIREGLIKKVGNDYFYAATTHDAGLKLFATDIINMGAVLKCDWQGVPKINEYLIPTTYNIPPETDEVEGAVVMETGQVQIGKYGVGLFFNIDCGGLHVTTRQCLNVRHICEFGVEIDENRLGEGGPATDGIIGISDLDADDGDRPKWFRDVFLGLNKNRDSWDLSYPFTSNFNLNDYDNYDFASSVNNGVDYVNFRNYGVGPFPVSGKDFGQFDNSFYFYFGIKPGKTALEKMNKKFFTNCPVKTAPSYNIIIKTTPLTLLGLNNGTVTINFVGGSYPIEYSISGANGYNNEGVVTGQFTIGSLPAGIYIITAIDSNGVPISQSFTIGNPPVLYAFAYVSKTNTGAELLNGEITITDIGGGVGPYQYSIYDSSCNLVNGPQSFNGLVMVTGFPVDVLESNCFGAIGVGYTVVATDSIGNSVYVRDLVMDGPSLLTVVVEKTDILCGNDKNGKISLGVTGGSLPYSISVTSENGYNGTVLNSENLAGGVYNILVTDANNVTNSSVVEIISINPPMIIEKVDSEGQQCDQSNHHLRFKITTPWASSAVAIQYSIDFDVEEESSWITVIIGGYVDSNTVLDVLIPKDSFEDNVAIRMVSNTNSCYSNELNYDIEEVAIPPASLQINTNSPNIGPITQASNILVNFKFNISDLVSGIITNGPYTATYEVTGINNLGSSTEPMQSIQVTTNQQLITAVVPKVSFANATSCMIKVKIKDKNGCESNTMNINQNLP